MKTIFCPLPKKRTLVAGTDRSDWRSVLSYPFARAKVASVESGGANASHFNRTNEAAGTTFFPNQVGKIASAINVSSTFPTWSTRVRVRAKVVAPDDRAGLQTRGCVRPWQGVGSPNSRGTRYTPTHPRRSASR